jgi:hypothetical protein
VTLIWSSLAAGAMIRAAKREKRDKPINWKRGELIGKGTFGKVDLPLAEHHAALRDVPHTALCQQSPFCIAPHSI